MNTPPHYRVGVGESPPPPKDNYELNHRPKDNYELKLFLTDLVNVFSFVLRDFALQRTEISDNETYSVRQSF